ncbi:hypothetical protein Tco_0612541 [Tanacetum coccineum]
MAAYKPTAKEGGKKKTASKPDKPKKPVPTKQSKPVKEIATKTTPSKKASKGKVMKISLESFQEPIEGVAIHEPASGVTRNLLVIEGKGKCIATDEQATPSLLDLQKPKKKTQPEDDTSANIVHDTPSPTDAETIAKEEKSNSVADTEILNIAKDQGEEVSNTVALEERIVELDKGQAGSDPGDTLES